MAYSEPDRKSKILNEIRHTKDRIGGLETELPHMLLERKFLNHKLADLNYELTHLNSAN